MSSLLKHCGLYPMLWITLLFATACFQNANVSENSGVQLAPAATATLEAIPVVELKTAEPLPVSSDTPTPVPQSTQVTVLEQEPTAVPQLSAAQIEATQIMIQATQDAEQAEALPTNQPVVADDEATDGTASVILTPTEVPDIANAASTANAGNANSCIHIVQLGDTMYSIAITYNTTVSTLATINNIEDYNVISVGQQITIPNCGTQLADNQDQPAVASAQVVEREITHVVQEGEGLFDIALRYGVTVAAIAQTNEIDDIDTVYLGQVLIIPSPD